MRSCSYPTLRKIKLPLGFVFSVGIFDKLSIFCESRESFGMNLIGNRLTVSEQCLDGPTSNGGSNGHTPGTPPHTRVVIRMGPGYHAEDGPAMKARRPKPRSVFQAFHILCRSSGIRSSLHQRGGGFIQANGLVNVPAVGRAHAVRAVSQGQRQVTLLTMRSPQGPEGLTRSTSPWFLLNSNPKAAKSSTAPVPRRPRRRRIPPGTRPPFSMCVAPNGPSLAISPGSLPSRPQR